MNAHTPTPWRVFTTTDGRKLVGIGGHDGEGILDCGFGVWAWEDAAGIANANLVVKAVNSHDALVKALEQIANYTKDDKPPFRAMDRAQMAEVAREALRSVQS